MAVYEQHHVKRFIRDEVIDHLEFNPHQRAGGHNMFVVSEARKAGLRVREIDKGYYFYQGTRPIGSMRSMISSLVGHDAVKACGSKHVTKELLRAAEVPVPRGISVAQTSLEEAEAFFRTLDTPAVVKPVDGRGGEGVTCGIQTEQHFQTAWKKALASARKNSSIIVEEHVEGIDVRVYVVGGTAVAAGTRLPPFVVGNGVCTVEQLLETKRSLRDTNKYLSRMPIIVDQHWLENTDRQLASVPDVGEIVVLNPTVNLHQGGENVDVTGILAPELKDLAVAAVEAIPGLGVAGVDLLVPSPRSAENAIVLEMNSNGNISVHHLPAYGEPVNVAQAMVAEMLNRSERERIEPTS